MDLAIYKNKKVYINSAEKVDAILAKLVEVEKLGSGVSGFGFGKFDQEVRWLIGKVKIQEYFIEKFQELRGRYPQRAPQPAPVKPVNQPIKHKEQPKPKVSQPISRKLSSSFNRPSKNNTEEFGRRRPTGFITVIGETPKWMNEPPKPIELYSKRATYYNYYSTCRNCFSEKAHWHYADSNLGPIFLCSACKDKIF